MPYLDDDGEVECGHDDVSFCDVCGGCDDCGNCFCEGNIDDDESWIHDLDMESR